MTRHSSLLSSYSPTKTAAAEVTIGHVVAELSFTPNTLASLQVPGTDKTLLAAGGQDAEIHLSLHSTVSRSQRRDDPSSGNNQVWKLFKKLSGSINNSVLLSSLSLTRSHQSSIEPRLAVSNNDWSVKFYDIPIQEGAAPKEIRLCGSLKLEEPVNHSSISPDGRTLLSVGDSPKVYLHHLTGGGRITFSPIVTLHIPPPDTRFYSAALTASFSTAFSADGMKFAVASQEGVVAVWDVRSTKPVKVVQTDKSRLPSGHLGSGEASGWLSDDPYDWTRGNSKAPGWGTRNVKFSPGGTYNRPGHELMTFTEHTSLVHVLDARTFEEEEIVRIPGVFRRKTVSRAQFHPSTPSNPPHATLQRHPLPSSRAVRTVEDLFSLGMLAENGSATSWRPSQRTLHRGDGTEDDYEYDRIVVISPLGDSVGDENLLELLGRHGTRIRHPHTVDSLSLPGTRTSDGHGATYGSRDIDREAPEDAGMDVDELEGDCISSRGPSRSSSPPPSIHLPLQPSPSPIRSAPGVHHSNTRTPSRPRRRIARDEICFEQTLAQDYDYDIAGTCFDPDGGFLYVATTDSISEWAVRGAEKRWWSYSEWA
ncbi:hypothetical protein ID866_6323 [Astraeus odoratus]|nr:hypothetical protein ID866_6323 [Astraeus odoratus]